MSRVARVTVLAQRASQETVAENVFTLIRHRRSETLGPWANEPDEHWHSTDVDDGLTLWRLDIPYDRVCALVDDIVASGTLATGPIETRYDLSTAPRRHRAHLVHPPPTHASIVSRFLHHSADIIEYWCLPDSLPPWWLAKQDEPTRTFKTALAHLGYPLEHHPERVGNLMVAGADDEVTCRLTYERQTKSLRLEMSDAQAPLPGAYRATVRACDSGDEVLRRTFEIAASQTVIPVGTLVDRVGCEIYRTMDGHCVHVENASLVREVHVDLTMTGPTLDFVDRSGQTFQKVSVDSKSKLKIPSDKNLEGQDAGIRRLWLARQAQQSESLVRQEGKLVRFRAEDVDAADDHFVDLLRYHGDDDAPIYLADPYFMRIILRPHGRLRESRLLLRMFAATAPRPLFIHCGQSLRGDAPMSWRSDFPRIGSLDLMTPWSRSSSTSSQKNWTLGAPILVLTSGSSSIGLPVLDTSSPMYRIRFIAWTAGLVNSLIFSP